MTVATRNDVARLIPDVEDHAIVEILAMDATVGEIEAALVALTSDDESLVDIEHREGDRLHRLLRILNRSQIEAAEDRDR